MTLPLRRIAFANIPKHLDQVPERRRLELFVRCKRQKIAPSLFFDRRHHDHDVQNAAHMFQSEHVILLLAGGFDVPVPCRDKFRQSAKLRDGGINHGSDSIKAPVAGTVNSAGKSVKPLSLAFEAAPALVHGIAIAADRVPFASCGIAKAKLAYKSNPATVAAAARGRTILDTNYPRRPGLSRNINTRATKASCYILCVTTCAQRELT